MFADGGRLYPDGGDLAEYAAYFPGMTYEQLAGLIYDNNKNAFYEGAYDKDRNFTAGKRMTRRQFLDEMRKSNYNLDTLLKNHGSALYNDHGWSAGTKSDPLSGYLLNAYYASNPEARNSRVTFSPIAQWDPLVIQEAYRAASSDSKSNPDLYKAITEEAFTSDPAFAQLTAEQKKLKGRELAKALEGTPLYKAFRDYLTGNEQEALKWLHTIGQAGSNRAKRAVSLKDGKYAWNDGYGTGKNSFAQLLKDISYDADVNPYALSVGHLTPTGTWSDRYWLKNADGTYSLLTGRPEDGRPISASPQSGGTGGPQASGITAPARNPGDKIGAAAAAVPAESADVRYRQINTDPYNTQIDGKNYHDWYYEALDNAGAALAADGASPVDAGGKMQPTDTVTTVDTLPEWPRYAGLFGPAAGLAMQGLGIGKPDFADLDAAVNAAVNGVTPIRADVAHIGDHLVYKPLDRDYYLNKLEEQNGATRRALLNSGSTPSRAASILAADYQGVGRMGDLARQAEEYNFTRRKDVGEFNRGTHQFNAQADNAASLQYADDYNRQKQFALQAQLDAAKVRLQARNDWYNGIYGNVGGLFKGIANLGTENRNTNEVRRLAASGALGNMNDIYMNAYGIDEIDPVTGISLRGAHKGWQTARGSNGQWNGKWTKPANASAYGGHVRKGKKKGRRYNTEL